MKMQKLKRKGLDDMHTDLIAEQQEKIVLDLDPEDKDKVEM